MTDSENCCAGSYNKLSDYFAVADRTYSNTCLLGIYLRTGSQADYSAIEDEGFRILDRSTFLNFLESAASDGLSNAILLEYRRHLRGLEDEYVAYRKSPLKEWNDKAWIGFYHEELLKSPDLQFADYGYVSNPQGGFQSCWWSNEVRKEYANAPIYLQLEQHVMTFKVGPVDDKQQRTATVREVYHHIHQNLLKGNNLKYGIERPGRLSPGKYMTAARVNLTEHLGESAGYKDLLQYLRTMQDIYYQLF